MIKKYIDWIAFNFPIEWDRFVEKDGEYGIYGWIKRKDGQRDFVLLEIYEENGQIKGGFSTSSAKYSKKLHEFLYGKKVPHNPCKKIEELK
jgi:hypothetical protein